MDKLNAKAFGWAFGAIEAFFVFISWLMGMFGPSSNVVDFIGSFYIGFGLSLGGLIIGLVEAVVVGFVAGYLVALVYNKFA